MKKVLIISSVASMIQQFNRLNIDILEELGYEITIATNFESPGNISKKAAKDLENELIVRNIKCIQLDFKRGIGSLKSNFSIFVKLRKLKRENYDVVHIHSPIAGILTRLAFINSKAKIIYTAHGFHFYRGGPYLSWVIFYPLEKMLSYCTDILLTINNDDTNLAKKRFHAKKVIHIPGVGINWEKFQFRKEQDYNCKQKEEYGLEEDYPIFLSVGELNDNKNHETAIRAIMQLNEPVYYLIAGIGKLDKELEILIESLDYPDRVRLLGYVSDVPKLLNMADFFVFLSKREGLGLAALEAMASGLPLISSYVGGIKDYTENNVTGLVIQNPTDIDEVASVLEILINKDKEELENFSKQNKLIPLNYDESKVREIMMDIYSQC